jgi:hypothetical protein
MGIHLCCRTTSVFFKAVVSGRSSIAVGGQCDSQGVQGKLIFGKRCVRHRRSFASVIDVSALVLSSPAFGWAVRYVGLWSVR